MAPDAGASGSFLTSRSARVAMALALSIGLMGLIAAQRTSLPAPDARAAEAGIDTIPGIAAELFGRYSLAFEAAGVLLLATMIAVVVLAKRQRKAPLSARAPGSGSHASTAAVPATGPEGMA